MKRRAIPRNNSDEEVEENASATEQVTEEVRELGSLPEDVEEQRSAAAASPSVPRASASRGNTATTSGSGIGRPSQKGKTGNTKLRFLPRFSRMRPRTGGNDDHVVDDTSPGRIQDRIAGEPTQIRAPFPPSGREHDRNLRISSNSATASTRPGAYAAAPWMDTYQPQSSAQLTDASRSTAMRGNEDTPSIDNETNETTDGSHQEPYMAVANLVTEPDLPRAEVVDQNDDSKKRAYVLLLLRFGLLMIIAIGVTVAVVVMNAPNGRSEGVESSPAPTAGNVSIPSISRTNAPSQVMSAMGPTGSPSPTTLPQSANPTWRSTIGDLISVAPTAAPQTSDSTWIPTFVQTLFPVETWMPTWIPTLLLTWSPTIEDGVLSVPGYGEYLLTLFPNETVQEILTNSSSPQGRAFEFAKADVLQAQYPAWRIRQRFALATFYYAMGGEKWSNNTGWVELEDECQWFSSPSLYPTIQRPRPEVYFVSRPNSYGIFDKQNNDEQFNYTLNPNPCNRLDVNDKTQGSKYQHLWLWENGLEGTFPLEFYWLTSLRTVNLDTLQRFRNPNGEIGPLASNIGLLTDLEFLSLLDFTFTTVPTEIGMLSNLKYLLIDNNGISGAGVFEQVITLTKLEYLGVRSNYSFEFPEQISALTKLSHLFLTGDWNLERVNAPLPSLISSLTTLKTLFLNKVSYTDTLPTEIGRLSSLRYLSIFGGEEEPLSGVLPTEIGLLESLQNFSLSYTGLSGPLPTELGKLSSIVDMHFSHNRFTGTLPSELGDLSSMRYLRVYGSALTGTIPSELDMIPNLQGLHLMDSGQTGTIPESLCDSMVTTTCSSRLCGCGCPCPVTSPPTVDMSPQTTLRRGRTAVKHASGENVFCHPPLICVR